MATIYRITMKSMEQRGATQPNIVELGFGGDGDANTFGANLENVCLATNVSNDVTLSSNYALPYPEGTDSMTRTAITDGVGHWYNQRIYDTPAAFAPATRAAALIAAGYLIFPNGETATAANVTVFTPGPSV